MQILDLHGVQHRFVDESTRRFFNFVSLPCEVITGNSPKMKKIVKNIVKQYGWFCYEKDSYNYGSLIVVENKI